MRGALAYRLRAELRGSWRGAAAVALLVAVLAGTVLAAVAGARRTESAFPRLLASSEAASLLVSADAPLSVDPRPFYERVASLPGVDAAAVVAGLPVVPVPGSPTDQLLDEGGASESFDLGNVMGGPDGRFGYELSTPRVVDGRLPDPGSREEVLVSRSLARLTGLRTGDVLEVVVQHREAPAEDAAIVEERLDLTVTGVGVLTGDVVPYNALGAGGTLLATPALARSIEPWSWRYSGVQLNVEEGVAIEDVEARARALGADGALLGPAGSTFIVDETESARAVQDAIRPLEVALLAFAAVTAVVGVLVGGQALSRHTRVPQRDRLALVTMGLTGRDLAWLAVARAALVGAAGGAGAVVIAVALSPLLPIGPARIAEPDPGVDVDLVVLAAAIPVVTVLSAAAVLAAVLLRRSGRRAAASRLAEAAARSAVPVTATQGVRFALDPGPGPDPTPVRSTVVATVAAVAALVTAATFSTSLGSLVDSPARYGQTWDRLVDGSFAPAPAADLVERFGDHADVAGMAVGSYERVLVDGRPVAGIAMRSVRGGTGLPVVRGERADGDGEIALGGEVLDQIGASVGDTVAVDVGRGAEPFEVVGEVVFPRFSQGSFGTTGLGTGAQLHPDAALPVELGPDQPVPDGYRLDGRLHHFVAIDVRGDPGAIDAELEAMATDGLLFAVVHGEQLPTTIADLDRVRTVPFTLAAVLAVSAAAVLAHLLLSAVRARRRDLALLRTLGFVEAQLRATVSWQATAVAVVAVAVGFPLGIAAGRTLWSAFADGIYAPSAPAVPWVWLLVAGPLAVVLANVVAAVPARRASRISPAGVLRAG